MQIISTHQKEETNFSNWAGHPLEMMLHPILSRGLLMTKGEELF